MKLCEPQFNNGLNVIIYSPGILYMYNILHQLLYEVTELKVHNVFPNVIFPPWLHPVKIWLHIVEKHKFQCKQCTVEGTIFQTF